MERRSILAGFDSLIFIIIKAAFETLQIFGKSMTAGRDLSNFAHL